MFPFAACCTDKSGNEIDAGNMEVVNADQSIVNTRPSQLEYDDDVPEARRECSKAAIMGKRKSFFNRKNLQSLSFTGSRSGEVEWLNELVIRLFPRIDQHIQNVVTDRIMPQIEAKLPSFLKGSVKVERIVMNKAIPRIGPIEVRDRGNEQDGAIVLDIGIDLDAEMVVDVKISKFNVGIKALLIHGALTVALRPALHRPPFFGGMEIYFVNPPDVDMDFTGVADIADFKGIKGLVRTAIYMAISEAMVIPSRIAKDLAPGDDTDIADLRFPDPLGVIRLSLLSGKGLLPMDVSFLGKPTTSDPYVVVRLGKDVWKSPVVMKTLTPTWKDDAVAYLSLYDERQNMDFQVWDQDRLTKDDRMGDSQKMPARSMFDESQRSEHEIPLSLEDKDAGSITIATEWFILSRAKPDKPTQLFIAVKVNDVIGLPTGSTPPFTVVVKLTKEVQVSSTKSKPMDHLALKPVQESLQVIILKMHHHNMPISVIADCVSLREEQVKYILQFEKDQDPVAANESLIKASKERQNTVPRFDQILRVLLPWTNDVPSMPIEVSLLDGKGKQVGKAATIPFEKLLAAQDLQLEGPFSMGGEICFHGTVRARWLASQRQG